MAEFRPAFAEPPRQFNVIFQRPAAQREIFGAARTDVEAEQRPAGKIFLCDEILRPSLFRIGQEKFVAMRRQFWLRAHQRQQRQIIFRGVPRIILRNGFVGEPAVERAEAFIFVADAQRRADERAASR